MKNRKFKIGDRVLYQGKEHTIVAYDFTDPKGYTIKGPYGLHQGDSFSILEDGSPYKSKEWDCLYVNESFLTLIERKEMKKGIVKLSLEDAKKLYEQGGNFRTIALSAYSENELTFTPKDGDFIVSDNGCVVMVLIYKYHREKTARFHAFTWISEISEEHKPKYDSCCDYCKVRPATKEENQILLDRMHEDGKDWDPINKKIIPYRWRANLHHEYYYYVHNNYFSGKFEVASTKEGGTLEDNSMFKSHNYFRTKEEAQEVADKINHIFEKL